MILNVYGKIVKSEILKTAEMRPEIQIDTFVIMPNHVHMIIHIVGNDRVVPMNDSIYRGQSHCLPNGNNAIVPYENRANELIPRIMK